jgi:hypothetical protein
MVDREITDLQNYTKPENVLVGPYGETYAACRDASQALNIKVEGLSDAEEEKDPVPRAAEELKVEPEVSFECACVSAARRTSHMQKCE